MNRGDAYCVLAAELNLFSKQGFDSLLLKVGCTTSRVLRIGQEDVTIETTVGWNDARKRTIRVNASALGPTCFRIERLEESIVVHPTIDRKRDDPE